MKRSVLMILLSLTVACLSVNAVGAVPMLQESGSAPENVDLLRAVSVFSQIFSAGMEAAAENMAAEMADSMKEGPEEPLPETAVTPETAVADTQPEVSQAEAAAEPVLPEPVLPEPEPLPEPVIPEISGPQEAQVFAPPSDPERYAVSFGIPVNRFYSSFKSEVKSRGVHAVAFEEKGRKSASKITVDGEINIFTYFSKETSENLISRINFETKIADEKQLRNTEVIFCSLLETLCGYYEIAYDDGVGSDLFDLVMADGSAVLGDLLVYGSTEQNGGGTELTVKLYRSGN